MRVDWDKTNIESVCKLFTDGNWIETKDQSPEGIRLIQTGNVGNGQFKNRKEKARYIDQRTFDRLKCHEIFEGDCLISRLPDPVGRACLIPSTDERMITAVDCSILRFDKEKIEPLYFSYYSQSMEYQKDVETYCTGATRKRISRKNLNKIIIPLPPLPEQKRIVDILDESFSSIDEAIANTEKNLANAREIFESYLNDVFAKKGENWNECILSEICDVRDGTHDSPKYVDEGIPFVTQKNIRKHGLCLKKTKYISEKDHNIFIKRSNVSFGDILISMIGVNRGMACLVDDNRNFSIKNVGLVKSSGNLHMPFLLYYLKSDIARKYVDEESRGGAQPFIGLGKLRAFPILSAPIEEQISVTEVLDRLSNDSNSLIENYQKKLNSLNELKQSLLAKAFSGELTASSDDVLKEVVG